MQLTASTPRRAGTTLVELLIALPVLALVSAIALMLLLSAQRATQHADRMLTNAHELRQAQSLLASEFRSLAATDISTWSDTSIDLKSTIGTGIACNGRGTRDRIDLLPERTRDPLRTTWMATAQVGDEVRLYLNASGAANPRPFRTAIRSLAVGRACPGSPLVDSAADPAAPTRTVWLRDTLPASLLAGYPVRIVRLVRYALYQSGGEWFLGRREYAATGWDVIQPVAGPLLPPAARGLFLQVRDGNATVVAPGDTTARLIHIELRAPARPASGPNAARRAAVDSAVVDVTLRAALDIDARANDASDS